MISMLFCLIVVMVERCSIGDEHVSVCGCEKDCESEIVFRLIVFTADIISVYTFFCT